MVRPVAKEGREVQMSAMYPSQIWMHVLGICKISKTNVLVTSGLLEDNIKVDPQGEEGWGEEERERERAAKGRTVIGSDVKNAAS